VDQPDDLYLRFRVSGGIAPAPFLFMLAGGVEGRQVFAGGAGDIRDPMGHDEDRYRATRDEIHRCLERSLDRLLALLH